ncbi:putative lysozyme [Hyphomonas neptunium ATCC 15444]|uniref:Lysozyme n=2 Tax=Hyphomonas TaxID=85 RepID=Q0C2Q4_HYPNA|nr:MULTISPECIES: lysozyme [Hyphomonas]ABI76125.1 putative lysozyme [Hyphomonas neptunium ATCC 15444]KCZ95777.1 putative lysozyme [Hyphomonas hirschiana VP5]
MGGPLRTSAKGLELIKGFEGFRPRASRLPDGRWIVGYGHTRTARPGLQVTPQDAELVLAHSDLPLIEQLIQDEVLAPLTQNEFDALVSFAWNIGPGAFQSSSVLANLNEGDRLSAASDMWLWRKGRVSGEVKIIDALVRRRAAEISLFLTHPSGPAAVPGALIRPIPEDGGQPFPPASERTVIIEARGEGEPLLPRGRTADTTPKAAARAVSERIARILGESPPPPPSTPGRTLAPGEEGPSVEEITRAIADLAGPADDAPLPPATGGVRGAPDGIERRRPARTQPPSATVAPPPVEPAAAAIIAAPPVPEALLPPAEAVIVDDLAPVEIDENGVQRALEENGHVTRPPGAETLGRWVPYALLSGLGLVSLVLGIGELIDMAAEPALHEGEAWLGPLLALGGGFLFVVATYYLYRAMTQDE